MPNKCIFLGIEKHANSVIVNHRVLIRKNHGRLLSLLTLAVLSPLAFSKTIIHAGNWWILRPERYSTQSVVVEDDRITAVVSGYLEEDGATVIDMTGGYVMPGSWTCTYLRWGARPPASYSEDFT